MGKDLKGKELGVGIYQRSNGLYEAKATIKGIKIDLYDKSLKSLRERFEEAKSEVRDGVNIRLKEMPMDEWFDEWFEKYKKPYIRESSVQTMRSKYTGIFSKYIGNLKVKDIKSLHIQNVITQELKVGRALSSLREGLGQLSRCLESAKNNGLIKGNPCFDIKVPKEQTKSKDITFMDIEDIEDFLSVVKNTFYYEMYYIMIYTGLRIGEVGGLKWCDVDFKEKKFHIRQSLTTQYNQGVKKICLGPLKTVNSYRNIPFLGDVEDMLISWKEKQDGIRRKLGNRYREVEGLEDLVFTTSMGSPLTRYTAEKQINLAVNQVNMIRKQEGKLLMKHMHPHALRHTFCSLCFHKGITPKVVQMLMGHANYSTTIEIYTHIFPETYEQEIAKFNNLDLGIIENPDEQIMQEILRTRGSNKLD